MVQSQMLQDIVGINFLPLMVVVFLFIFIKINDPYEHNITLLFSKTLAFLMLLIVCDNVDYACYNDQSLPVWLHTLAAALGYNLRILCLLSLIHIIYREGKRTRLRIWLLNTPALFTFLATLTCPFSHLMFWYDSEGAIQRGPLFFVPHMVALGYSGFVISYSVYLAKRRSRRDEGIILVTEIICMILATSFELIFQLRGILMGMIAIGITFYYLYMHIAHFRQDALTGALNRASFYADVKKYGSENITALISIDVNNLKTINDTSGHDAGDEMLKEVVGVIGKKLKSGCELYRVGGDEFFVICLHVGEREVKNMLERIDRAMSETKYTWASGVSVWKEGMKFIDVYKEADQMMYERKFEMKRLE